MTDQIPNVNDGLAYWEAQPADLDGVLGGFGSSTLPRVDALSSRQFLLSLLPELSIVPSAIRPLQSRQLTRRTRALDVGAGIGRVTTTVLLHLFDDVVLVEPVENFVREALYRVTSAASTAASATAASVTPQCKEGKRPASEWKGVQGKRKSVTVVKATLQEFDPRALLGAPNENAAAVEVQGPIALGRLGYTPPQDQLSNETSYDIIWCQWCLGHLSDADLVSFLKRAREALRLKSKSTGELEGCIIVKENVCNETELGQPLTIFDESDSSLTRSDLAWKAVFKKTNLRLLREEVQRGFPRGLFPVKTYALR